MLSKIKQWGVNMEKLAVVTGATGGLGGEFCRDLLKRGYDIIISGTAQDRVDKFKTQLESEFADAKIWAKECNLASEESRNAFFDYLTQQGLHPSTLINCAGYILEGSFLGCENSEVLGVIEVNNVGTVDFTYKFLKRRDENERNYVLFVSSLASFYPMPQMAMYGASKSFLTSFSVALRRELKDKNVFVTALCPGSIATNDAMKRSIKSQGVGGRLSLQPTDKIAHGAINSLLKNKAKYVPGGFNKFVWFVTRFTPQTMVANFTYKRWTKCEKKRGEYR